MKANICPGGRWLLLRGSDIYMPWTWESIRSLVSCPVISSEQERHESFNTILTSILAYCFNPTNCNPLSVKIHLESCRSILISFHHVGYYVVNAWFVNPLHHCDPIVIRSVKALEDALLQVVKNFWLCLILPPFCFNWFLWNFTSDSSESFLHSTYRCKCLLCFNQNYHFGYVCLLSLR